MRNERKRKSRTAGACVWQGRKEKHRIRRKMLPELPLGIGYKFKLGFLYEIV